MAVGSLFRVPSRADMTIGFFVNSLLRLLRRMALHLFLQKGYAVTSYTVLATEYGVARTLIQLYYPGCVVAVRSAAVHAWSQVIGPRSLDNRAERAVRAWDQVFPDVANPLICLCLRDQLNVAMYFVCDGIRRLVIVLCERNLPLRAIAD